MGSFLKRIIELILLIVLIWFGSIIAYKEYIQNELIHIRILTDTRAPVGANIVTQIQLEASKIFENKCCNCTTVPQRETSTSLSKSELMQVLESVLKRNRVYQGSTITITDAEHSMLKFPDYFVPAGLYETIEIQIGNGDMRVAYEGIFLKCGLPLDVSRLPDNRSILQNVVLNCIGALENTFHLE